MESLGGKIQRRRILEVKREAVEDVRTKLYGPVETCLVRGRLSCWEMLLREHLRIKTCMSLTFAELCFVLKPLQSHQGQGSSMMRDTGNQIL